MTVLLLSLVLYPQITLLVGKKIKGLAHPVTDADCLASCGLSAALLTLPSLGWVGLS